MYLSLQSRSGKRFDVILTDQYCKLTHNTKTLVAFWTLFDKMFEKKLVKTTWNSRNCSIRKGFVIFGTPFLLCYEIIFALRRQRRLRVINKLTDSWNVTARWLYRELNWARQITNQSWTFLVNLLRTLNIVIQNNTVLYHNFPWCLETKTYPTNHGYFQSTTYAKFNGNYVKDLPIHKSGQVSRKRTSRFWNTELRLKSVQKQFGREMQMKSKISDWTVCLSRLVHTFPMNYRQQTRKYTKLLTWADGSFWFLQVDK